MSARVACCSALGTMYTVPDPLPLVCYKKHVSSCTHVRRQGAAELITKPCTLVAHIWCTIRPTFSSLQLSAYTRRRLFRELTLLKRNSHAHVLLRLHIRVTLRARSLFLFLSVTHTHASLALSARRESCSGWANQLHAALCWTNSPHRRRRAARPVTHTL